MPVERMEISEFVGFIITMAMLAFLFFRQLWEQKRRKENPEEYAKQEQEKEEALKEFLDSFKIQEKEEYKQVLEEAPPEVELPESPKLENLTEDTHFHFDTIIEEYDAHTRVEDYTLKTKIGQRYGSDPSQIFDKRVFDTHLGTGDVGDEYALLSGEPSRGKRLLQESQKLKHQMILRDILGPPKSFQ